MRVVVDADLCQGHARCAMVAPTIFELGEDDGHAVVVLDPVPAELSEAARRAVMGCPEEAITVEDD